MELIVYTSQVTGVEDLSLRTKHMYIICNLSVKCQLKLQCINKVTQYILYNVREIFCSMYNKIE